MAVPIIPRIERGRLYFETADVLLPTFAPAAGAWNAADALRRAVAGPVQPESRAESPIRRCDDCQLHLTGDVLRALGSCPRWGMPRHGVETCCPAFVAKDGAR